MKRRVNNTGTFEYSGFAIPMTAETDAAWLIMRETLATGDLNHVNNQGLSFNQKWSERASLVYDES